VATPSLQVDLQGSRVTSDGGLILVRDSRLGRRGPIPSPWAQPRKKGTLESLDRCIV
jgi:hypothetical protein